MFTRKGQLHQMWSSKRCTWKHISLLQNTINRNQKVAEQNAMKCDGRFSYKQLIGQTAINNIYIYIYFVFDCMNPDK